MEVGKYIDAGAAAFFFPFVGGAPFLASKRIVIRAKKVHRNRRLGWSPYEFGPVTTGVPINQFYLDCLNFYTQLLH